MPHAFHFHFMMSCLATLLLLATSLWSVGSAAPLTSDVLHFEQERGKLIEISGVDGKSIFLHAFPTEGAKKSVTIFPGLHESSRKWIETAQYFAHEGFSVYILNHRGQAFSERLSPHPDVVHVEKFDHYIDDAKKVFQEVNKSNNYEQRYLLAHSMGGAIATLYLAQHHADYHAAVLTAPMHGIQTGKIPIVFAKNISSFLTWLGRGQEGAPTRGNVCRPFSQDLFLGNNATHDEARWTTNNNFLKEAPNIRTCHPSNNWIVEATRATERMPLAAANIQVPILIFQAGKDTSVLDTPQLNICTLTSNCALVRFPHAKHEIFQESDALRNEALFLTLRKFTP